MIFRSSNPYSCQHVPHPRVKAMRRDRIAVVVDEFRILTSVNFSFLILIVVLPCMLTITQLLLQQNAHFYY
jgi:hypothetical protein